MMKISNVNVYGLEESIKGAKYPMAVNIDTLTPELTKGIVALSNTPKGEGHDQWLTGVTVQFDLTCSNKMWVEAERYRFLYFVSSQSTMHRIARFDIKSQCNEYVDVNIIKVCDKLKKQYLDICEQEPANDTKEEKDALEERKKQAYLKLLYNIPSGFELTARLTTNYRELKTIYAQRKNHRLPEWREFCVWVEELPKFKELCLGGYNVE